MLPPTLPRTFPAARRSSTSTLLPHQTPLFTPTPTQPRRTFWGWRRHDTQAYTSHLDPLYTRFTRSRTLKTRARLLEKLKRRGRFDWDVSQSPFFTPKHIRGYASHWNGGGRADGPPWQRSLYDKFGNKLPKQSTRNGQDEQGGVDVGREGYELSQREKEWKDRMEIMRKRIQRDPYEAVFGKRFEPFWSPLVPSWMREEMGLRESSTWEEERKKRVVGALTAADVDEAREMSAVTATTSDDATAKQTAAESKPLELKKAAAPEPKPDSSNDARSAYASYTSTSWDSRTNKTKTTSWDSASGQTKRFEYDPISNRMVQVGGTKPAESTNNKQLSSGTAAAAIDAPATESNSEKRWSEIKSLNNTPPLHAKAASIPVKTWSPVAAPRLQQSAQKAATLKDDVTLPIDSPTRSQTSHNSKPNPTKPAILSTLPASDLDFLSAEHVRASMGKVKAGPIAPKATTAAEKAALERDFDAKITESDSVTEEILLERELAKFTIPTQSDLDRYTALSERTEPAAKLQPAVERLQSKELPELDDSAAHESTEPLPPRQHEGGTVPKNWAKQAELLQSQRVKRTAGAKPKVTFPKMRWIDEMEKLKAAYEASKDGGPFAAEQAATAKLQKANALLEAEVKEQKARMQAHENSAKAAKQASGALHVGASSAAVTSLPAEQTTSPGTPRNTHEAKKARAKNVTLLEAKLAQQKVLLQDHQAEEGKYAHKLRSLREELDTAYKQSAVHSEKYVERIRFLEAQLAKAPGKAGSDAGSTSTSAAAKTSESLPGEGDMCVNVAKYAHADSGKWYKQPATTSTSAAEAQKAEKVARDRALVREVREIYENAYGTIEASHRQPVFSQDSSPGSLPGSLPAATTTAEAQKAVQKAAQVARDRALVAEVREIYENAYGAIEASHRQPVFSRDSSSGGLPGSLPATTVLKDVKLGEALAEHDEKQSYGFRKDGLEAELTAKVEVAKEESDDFRADGLEAELAAKAQVSKAKWMMQADGSAAEVKAQADWMEQLGAFEQDGLEAELAAKAEVAREDGMKRTGGFRADGLERELAAKAKVAREDRAECTVNFRADGLEAELAAKAKEAAMAFSEREAHDAQGLAPPEQLISKRAGTKPRKSWEKNDNAAAEAPISSPATKLVNDTAPKLIPTALSTRPASAPADTTSSVQWADPPLYKVLAYDSGNDMLTAASTTCNFTGSESPISIPQALSRLYQPARFVPHFAELQREGYQVIYGTRDLLVFKKVKEPEAEPAAEEASLVDHGLIKPKENSMAEDAANFYEKYRPAPKVYDPTSIENGTLMPYENAMAQEAAHAHDHARPAAVVNPIDGTTRSQVSTGNFASPTGFVNHDPLFPTGKKEAAATAAQMEKDSTTSAASSTKKSAASDAHRSVMQEEDVDYVHYPRVRRQEAVFSGTKRKWNDHHERHQRRHERISQRHQRRRGAGALKWALSVGAGAAALTYAIGVAAEAARKEERGKVERWQEVLEGKRGRWE